jgi:glycosyltransferase-like protein
MATPDESSLKMQNRKGNARLRIGMLCRSTEPSGELAHALALAEALTERGHDVVVHAPDPDLGGFPRVASCGLVSVPAGAAPAIRAAAGLDAGLAIQRSAELSGYFRAIDAGAFDCLHAHDGISANALLSLQGEGRIPGFVYTVHDPDAFDDPRRFALQDPGVRAAEAIACVSQGARMRVLERFGVDAAVVGNGVDLRRFSPRLAPIDLDVRRLFSLESQRPLVLGSGGIAARKNPVQLLEAFLRLRRRHPQARLLIAGSADLAEEREVHGDFLQVLARAGLAPSQHGPVTLAGRVTDAHLAPLLRAADVFANPAPDGGSGLAVLEALACGTPVVAARAVPLTEYLDDSTCRFTVPDSVASMTSALEAALDPWVRAFLRPCGFALARRMGWNDCAVRQEALYRAALTRRSACTSGAACP